MKNVICFTIAQTFENTIVRRQYHSIRIVARMENRPNSGSEKKFLSVGISPKYILTWNFNQFINKLKCKRYSY
jgi:hypothetical protein